MDIGYVVTKNVDISELNSIIMLDRVQTLGDEAHAGLRGEPSAEEPDNRVPGGYRLHPHTPTRRTQGYLAVACRGGGGGGISSASPPLPAEYKALA